MSHPIEVRGVAMPQDPLLTELVDRIRGMDERLGDSPDPVLGHPGSGLCRVVAELKSESDYLSRVRAEHVARSSRWRERISAGSALIGGFVIFAAAAWAVFRFATSMVR